MIRINNTSQMITEICDTNKRHSFAVNEDTVLLSSASQSDTRLLLHLGECLHM